MIFLKTINPVVLELACGKGEYTVNLARLFPQKNFIGIDYKGNRIWRGAKDALEDRCNQRRLSAHTDRNSAGLFWRRRNR